MSRVVFGTLYLSNYLLAAVSKQSFALLALFAICTGIKDDTDKSKLLQLFLSQSAEDDCKKEW